MQSQNNSLQKMWIGYAKDVEKTGVGGLLGDCRLLRAVKSHIKPT